MIGSRRGRVALVVGTVVALTLPWVLAWAVGLIGGLSTAVVVPTSGIAVIGAAFLLTWGAETAEVDVPRSFAIAVLAIIAVAPEYAVDALFAWEAGQGAGTPAGQEAANLAVANMTGANRILVGLGWSLIGLYAIARVRRGGDAVQSRPGLLADGVRLEDRIAVEVCFLGAATAYALFIPVDFGIGALDAVVLVGLYAAYVAVILREESEHEPALGVTGYFQELARARRIAVVLLLFAYSAFVILIAVKPFAKGLAALGPALGVSAFFMIQWVAPLASESPEFIATAYLVRKGRTTASFNALVSSKLNQWTLLIGTLVVVYSLALGAYGPLPFNERQAGEIWLTAAQSFFAIALLVDLRLSVREAVALLVLFLVQFHPVFGTYEGLLGFSAVYLLLGAGILVVRRRAVRTLFGLARDRIMGPATG